MMPAGSICSSRPPQVVSPMMSWRWFMLPTVCQVRATCAMLPVGRPVSHSLIASSEPALKRPAGRKYSSPKSACESAA